MPLSGALRHFFTFILCVMSTTSFVHTYPLPREEFLSPSYVLFIHIMALLVVNPNMKASFVWASSNLIFELFHPRDA